MVEKGSCMLRKFHAVGAVVFGILIVATCVYVGNLPDAAAMLWQFILAVFVVEIAVFIYFLVGALWKRKGRCASPGGDK